MGRVSLGWPPSDYAPLLASPGTPDRGKDIHHDFHFSFQAIVTPPFDAGLLRRRITVELRADHVGEVVVGQPSHCE
jgi:hypothetical protein